MKQIKIENIEIIRRTPKAVLVGFPEESEYSKYAVWFPKSKVNIKGKTALITLVGDEYQLVFKETPLLDRKAIAKGFLTEIIEEEN